MHSQCYCKGQEKMKCYYANILYKEKNERNKWKSDIRKWDVVLLQI